MSNNRYNTNNRYRIEIQIQITDRDNTDRNYRYRQSIYLFSGRTNSNTQHLDDVEYLLLDRFRVTAGWIQHADREIGDQLNQRPTQFLDISRTRIRALRAYRAARVAVCRTRCPAYGAYTREVCWTRFVAQSRIIS